MKDLYEIFGECLDEIESMGIEVGTIKGCSINTRAKTRWGQCKKRMGNYGCEYEIEISSRLLEDEVPVQSLKNTLIHELLHTCEGCMNHGTMWKKYADIMNKQYGYNITRVNSAENLGVPIEIGAMKYKYIITCKCCGQTIRRQKMSRFVQHPNRWTCGKCNTSDWKVVVNL